MDQKYLIFDHLGLTYPSMRKFKVDHSSPLARHYREQLPIQADTTGYSVWTHDAQCRRREGEDDIYVVEMIKAGSLTFEQRGNTYTRGPGDMTLLQPGMANFYTTGPTNYVLKRHVVLGGSEIARIWQSLGLDALDVLRPPDPSAVWALMRHIAHINRHKPTGYIRDNAQTSYALLLALGVQTGPAIPDDIQAVIHYINRHLDQPSLTTDTLAKQVTLSVPHFNRLFKRHVGQSPRHFIQDQRIALSRSLLRETSLTIADVSQRCGYTDALYFSTRFKKKTGISPRDFRKRYQW